MTALMALGAHFVERPLRHSALLVATDAEERGLHGARALVSDHAAFHRAGIPFLYFGVEDRPD